MLFSNEAIARMINDTFEPAWEMVRPVPLVRIDFGNGHVITRTLNGNIATYVCTADGRTLDIVPGIYNAEGYAARLKQLARLHSYALAEGEDQLAARLKEYHDRQVEALTNNQEALELVRVGGVSKEAVEGRLNFVLRRPNVKAAAERRDSAKEPAGASGVGREDADLLQTLAEDTRINETRRRLQVSAMLAEAGPVQPQAIFKRLYKEVLHADLDDPYLGLGEMLFKNYPFTKEDQP